MFPALLIIEYLSYFLEFNTRIIPDILYDIKYKKKHKTQFWVG